MKTEKKILDASNFIFLKYGYHGTTIQKIADQASVSKSIVHYYYRSKNNLYSFTIKNVVDLMSGLKETDTIDKANITNSLWFLTTELHNNKDLFLQMVAKLYHQEWSGIADKIKINVINFPGHEIFFTVLDNRALDR